jgi:transcriptional regulator with XRE-family HTH domain
MFAYELARQLGIAETRFRRILKGRVRASAEELERIATALGLSIAELSAGAPTTTEAGANQRT